MYALFLKTSATEQKPTLVTPLTFIVLISQVFFIRHDSINRCLKMRANYGTETVQRDKQQVQLKEKTSGAV